MLDPKVLSSSKPMRVSVIIPTYNREETIVGAVESVLAQGYKNLDVVVVDDGSTDETIHALEGIKDRIKIVSQENLGPSSARNRGVSESDGEIVAFLDSDDHWMSDKIQRQVALMERGAPDMACCVCNATVIGEDGVVIGDTFDFAGVQMGFDEGVWNNPQDMLSTRFLLFNQVVAIRREVFERVGGFNESLRILEDYEFALRLSAEGSWGVIREPLVKKFNDTNGLGVECMTNRETHARIYTDVVSGLLEEGQFLTQRARRRLERGLEDMRIESRAHELMKKQPAARALGHLSMKMLKVRRGLRRRSPSWPRFQGAKL